MRTPNHVGDEVIAALLDGSPSPILAGHSFPSIDVRPDVPVATLARGLALAGLGIFNDRETGRLYIAESWKVEAERRAVPPMSESERTRHRMLEAGVEP
jgi:hypothetical protein